MRQFVLGFCSLIIVLHSCSTPDRSAAISEILEADKAFSEQSLMNGSNAAFSSFMAEDATLLRDNLYPLTGFTRIDSLLHSRNDSAFTLSWEPLYADVAASGDLGYSYGIWTYQLKADSTASVQGSYVTIWKKKQGKWEWVLDCGNEGLEPASKD